MAITALGFIVAQRARNYVAILLATAALLCFNCCVYLIFKIILLMDAFDKHIVQVLQQQGRIANVDLANLVGLSPAPCLRRVRQLEEAGVIQGYYAQLNNKALGCNLMALVQISMDAHTPERFAEFSNAIQDVPEILECLLITGKSADYQLKVVARDLDHFGSLLLQKITKIPGVTGVHSSFVLEQVKYAHQLPLL
jgi:Lrp/AsnC family leucine-responsive transcriptional regulator